MRIDFYVSQQNQPQARLVLACQLARRSWLANMPCWINCLDEPQQQQLDQMLWDIRSEMFMPHDLVQDNAQAPIVIALDETPVQNGSVVINLTNNIINPVAQTARIIELVCQEPALLEQSRHNYSQYRKLGFQPQRVEL